MELGQEYIQTWHRLTGKEVPPHTKPLFVGFFIWSLLATQESLS
jgi:hypothetical protein